MKELQIIGFGGPEVFRLKSLKNQPLTAGSVRIQVAYAGVNFADIMMRKGMYPEAPRPPFTPGYEVSGTVTEVANDVRDFAIGDRVLAGCRFGGYTQEIVVPAMFARKVPAHLSLEEAAAIPVAFLTAWLALHEMGRIRAGDRVLIQSAAGGVGTAAVQLAARAGAHVTGLTSNLDKAPAIRSLGAHQVMTYNEFARDKDLRFDLILDATGGNALKLSYRKLTRTGRVVSFGVSSMVGLSNGLFKVGKALSILFQTPIFTNFKLMNENRGIFGLNVLKFFEGASTEPHTGLIVRRSFDAIMAGFEAQELRVVVGKTFELKDGGAAQQHLQSRDNVGKVLLRCE